MAELDENKNGVFGGIEFGNGEENQSISNPYFEGTIEEPVIEEASNIGNGGVFGSFSTGETHNASETNGNTEGFTPIGKEKAIAKQGLWSRIKAFLFQEIDLMQPIKIELTPYQQKVENEINDFLHQEITFKGIANFFKGKK